MNRVRMLLGLLALFVSSSAYAVGHTGVDGNCYFVLVSAGGAQYQDEYGFYAGGTSSILGISGISASGGSQYTYFKVDTWYRVFAVVYKWDNGVWVGVETLFNNKFVNETIKNALLAISDGSTLPSSPPSDFCVSPVCNNADDDSDGVCNSCDSTPGSADKKHCVWQQLVVAGTGQVAIMAIDQSGNCDGSNTVEYRNSSVNDQVVSGAVAAYWTGNHNPIDPQTCQGDDGTGNCACGYTTSANSVFSNMEPSTTPQMSDGLKEQLQKADQAANDDKYDDCSNIKARCEAACLTRGGVVKNSCSVSDGTTYAKCECKNEFAFDTATPTETSTDTSTNGDVAQTGGTDTNADGKADTYAAVKDAIKDSGLTSKVDSTNTHLNSIGNKIDTVGSAINSVSSAVNGVTDGINGLGSGINGVGNGINGLGTKLDTIADKLDNLNGNDNQDITATGSADLPGNNTYNASVEGVDQISLADTIGAFITNGLPIVSYFKGSHIEIGSAIPTLSTHIFGKTITIDFSGMESILNDMGLVLVSVSTILSFMIIIRG